MQRIRLACAIGVAGLLYAHTTALAQSAPQDKTPRVETIPQVIPIFPLEVTMLFPGVPRPLHIFEPRYRAMVADALKGDRIIGMTTLRPGYETDYQGRPPVYDIGCAGVITEVEELPDGRFNIVLRGVVKFRVTGEDNSRAYRLARIDAMPEALDDSEKAALNEPASAWKYSSQKARTRKFRREPRMRNSSTWSRSTSRSASPNGKTCWK